MALVTMTTTVDSQTGTPINTFSGVSAGDVITGLVLRRKMSAGAYIKRLEDLSVTISDGSQSSATIPGSIVPIGSTNGKVREDATISLNSDELSSAVTLKEFVDFTISGSTITFTPAITGTNKVVTISYSYYDQVAANLVYDVPVSPSNTTGVITVGGYNIILWSEGVLAQGPKLWATTGTANGVIEALITNA